MHFWRINSSTDKMIARFNEEASACDGVFVGDRPKHEYIRVTQLDNVSDPALMTESVRAQILHSTTTSMTTSTAGVRARGIKHTIQAAKRALDAGAAVGGR
jgi:hypothetical protein